MGVDEQVTVQPTTGYARSGNVSIAYRVVGDGRRDLVNVAGWVSHLERTGPPFLYFKSSWSALLASPSLEVRSPA